MLRLNMSKCELRRELEQDDKWAKERINGIFIKFRKQLSKFPEGKVFYKCWYTTPNHNRIRVFYSKTASDLIALGAFPIAIDSFFEIIGDDGKIRYVSTLSTADCRLSRCLLYTSHLVQRLHERLGLDFETWFEGNINSYKSALQLQDYEYNGDERQCYAIINKTMVFGVYSDNFDAVFTTLISQEQEHANQLLLHYQGNLANNQALAQYEKEQKYVAVCSLPMCQELPRRVRRSIRAFSFIQ